MKLKTITIDLAKTVFQVCGVNEHIKPQFNKKLKRTELLDFMRQQPPTLVVMEACYSSHYWGREIAKLGHDTKLIPAQQKPATAHISALSPLNLSNSKKLIVCIEFESA